MNTCVVFLNSFFLLVLQSSPRKPPISSTWDFGTGTGTGTLTEGKTGRIDGKTGNTVLDGPMGVIDAGGHGGINGFDGAEIGDSEGGHGGGEVSGIGGFGMLQCELDGTSVATVELNEGNIAD